MQWLSIRRDFVPQGIFGNDRRHFLNFDFDWGSIPSGWRPGMLLDILQCTEQPPTTENDHAPNAGTAKLRNPMLNTKR